MYNDQNNIEESAQRIAFLLQSYILNKLTPGEKEELNNWVEESEENKNCFLELTDRRELLEELDIVNTKFNLGRSLQQVKSRLHFAKKEPQKSILSYWRWAVAASLISIIGITGVFTTLETGTFRNVPSKTVTSGIFPDKSQARLVTNDLNIYLDRSSNGIISSQASYTITADSGHVKYNALANHNAQISPPQNLLSTPRGGSYSFELSDGTKVWLNSASSIKFSPIYSGKERRVEMTGEVYFEVASASVQGPNYRKPFIVDVKGRDVSIEVLGTSFNVKAYPEEDAIKTSLFEGAIKVTTPGHIAFLKPGDQAEISGNSIQTSEDTVSEAVKSWVNGVFNFKNENAKTILNEIGRWYGVEIVFEGPIDNTGYNLNVSRNFPISAILDAIVKEGRIQFTIMGRKIIVSSTDPNNE